MGELFVPVKTGKRWEVVRAWVSLEAPNCSPPVKPATVRITSSSWISPRPSYLSLLLFSWLPFARHPAFRSEESFHHRTRWTYHCRLARPIAINRI